MKTDSQNPLSDSKPTENQHAPIFGTLSERVPPEALRRGGSPEQVALIRAAADVASGVHRPGKAASRAEHGRAQQERLDREAAALREWAEREGLILPTGEFGKHWRAQEEIEGAEHEVYLGNDGRTVWKRNNLSYHHSWQEYFERLLLHNWLFPEAPMALQGFDVDEEGQFRPVITQTLIVIDRGAARQDVQPWMEAQGFKVADEKGLNFYHPIAGIIVEDLHDENAVFDMNGRLIVFDPVIYPIVPDNQIPRFTRLGLI